MILFLLPLHSLTKSNFVLLSRQTNHKNPIISISLSTSIPSLWTFHRRYHFFPPLEVTLFSFSSIHQSNITLYGEKLSLMHASSICPVCILPSNREGAHGFHFHGYSKKFKKISLIYQRLNLYKNTLNKFYIILKNFSSSIIMQISKKLRWVRAICCPCPWSISIFILGGRGGGRGGLWVLR